MSGETTSGSLSDASPEIIADARLVREFAGVFMRTCRVERQEEGTGLLWQQFNINQIEKSTITETTTNNNAQTISGSLINTEPVMSQVIIKVTDRTYRKIAKVVSSKFGTLAGNAMKRGKDEDYLSLFSTFSTTNSPGTGQPLSFGHVSSAVANIEGNTNEPSEGNIFSILHQRGIKDIQDEILAGVGTYTIPEGMTEATFRQGFRGSVAGSNVFGDGNITIDSTPDARGATHAREAVILVNGMEITTKEDYDLYFGGGAAVMSMVDEYAFVEDSVGNWAYQHLHDATAPTN